MGSRFMLRRHLDEKAIASLWAEAAASGTAPAHPHLDACTACRVRSAEFGLWLDGLREEALAEADEAFPPERLLAQQAQIARRLESLERPGRVIAFPRFARPLAAPASPARRWIAAAAVVGLLTGFSIERAFHFGERFGGSAGPAGAPVRLAGSQVPRAPVANLAPASLVEDEYLWNMEEAIPPKVDELMALDLLTPRVRDIGVEGPR